MITAIISLTATAAPFEPLPIRIWIGGEECYEVPLVARGEGLAAIVDADTYEDLQARGVTLRWSLTGPGSRYVFATGRASGWTDPDLSSDTPRYLSRIITQATPDDAVTYTNGNTLDLRRSNLVVVPRGDLLPWASTRGRRKEKRADA